MDTKRKAAVLVVLIVVVFGAAAAFAAWSFDPGTAVASVGAIG